MANVVICVAINRDLGIKPGDPTLRERCEEYFGPDFVDVNGAALGDGLELTFMFRPVTHVTDHQSMELRRSQLQKFMMDQYISRLPPGVNVRFS